MINKIKELAKEAGGMEILDTRGFGEMNGGMQFSKESFEKFADLLIKECAEYAEGLRHVYPHQGEITCDSIKEHFDVK